ncbi:MAG: hypothetical protein V3V13_13280 [Paracoccaceae bacterium]
MNSDNYTTFIKGLATAEMPLYVSIFHAVRNIPYGVTGERSPDAVLKNHLGSCSGKHILLRDLLITAGFTAEVVTIYCHFNKGLPQHSSFPPDLAEMIRKGEMVDYHHYVRAQIDGDWLHLDATWPDALQIYGFPVNIDWKGVGHTHIAATAIEEYAAVDNLAEFKQGLIAALPRDVREARSRFFAKLTQWMQQELPPSNVEKTM